MDKEVELILSKLKLVSEEQERGLYLCDKEHSKLLLDYITNLQQLNLSLVKENEQEKQFIKDCGFENGQQLVLDYIGIRQENERLKLELSGYREAILRDDKLLGLQKRIEKAVEYINCNKQKIISAYGDNEDDDFEICLWEEDIDDLLNILNGRSDE